MTLKIKKLYFYVVKSINIFLYNFNSERKLFSSINFMNYILLCFPTRIICNKRHEK